MEKKSYPIWAVICFVIALFCLLMMIAFIGAVYVSGSRRSVAEKQTFLGGIFLIPVVIIALLGFVRVGVRMLNTGNKFFETPVVEYGPSKLIASLLLNIAGATICFFGITIIILLITQGNSYEFLGLMGVVGIITFLIVLGGVVIWLGHRLKKSVFKKTEIEFMGETF